MKSFTKILLFISVVTLISGCNPKPVKTIENLKAAFNGESTASSKYAAFAEKALAEGFDTIAVMFLATSKSEAVHANNHKMVLEKLGVKAEEPMIGPFEVLSTSENLADAIRGETFEVETMYPGFIETGRKEKSAEAIKAFTWAVGAEKKHMDFYARALSSVNENKEKSLPAKWFVCPVCGNTYDNISVTAACEICLSTPEIFLSF